jgi:hypothetical protein
LDVAQRGCFGQWYSLESLVHECYGQIIFMMGLRLGRCAPSAALRCAAHCRSAPPLLRCGRVCALTRAPLRIARPLGAAWKPTNRFFFQLTYRRGCSRWGSLFGIGTKKCTHFSTDALKRSCFGE